MDIATSPNGTKISVLDKDRARTHTHIIGASGTGKSKLMESMIRQDIRRGNPLCLIDWHGTLYHEVLAYAARVNPPRPVVLLNLSKPDFLLGFNPFSPRVGDVSTQVENRISATTKPWGMENTDQTPRMERICRMLYHFLIEADENLYNAFTLLRFGRKETRQYALGQLQTNTARQLWEDMNAITSLTRWQDQTESTTNRLLRFVAQESIRISTSLRPATLDVAEIIRQKAILLINLRISDYLSMEAARVFAALLLNEFFEAAMRRASDPPPSPYYLYLDEFQEYITSDMSGMLDSVRKGGLHLIMAHQRMMHLYRQPEVLDSVLTNAKIRVVFGGLRYPAAAELAQEMMLHRINERQVVETYYHLETRYVEETREVHHESHGHSSSHGNGRVQGQGGVEMAGVVHGAYGDYGTESGGQNSFESDSEFEGESESEVHGTTTIPFLKPVQKPAKSGAEVRSRDEKVSMSAEKLMAQKQRNCVVKILDDQPEIGEVEYVNKVHIKPEVLQNFIDRCIRQSGALPFQEAKARVEESRLLFDQKVQKFLQAQPDPDKKKTFRTKTNRVPAKTKKPDESS